MIQAFRRLERDRVLAKLSFLLLLALIVFAGVAWQPTVNSAKIMIRVNPRWPLVRMLNDIIGTVCGDLSHERRAQGSSIGSIPFAENHDVGRRRP